MTEEQKQKLASLQTAFIVLQAKMCQAKTTTERDSAIKAAIIRLVAEPDKEVQEALLLWQARRLGDTCQNALPPSLSQATDSRWPRSAPLIGVSSDTVITPPWGPWLPSVVSSPARV